MPDVAETKGPLIESAGTVVVPARPNSVVVGDYFKKGARIRFATVWDEFKRRFFDKTEGPFPEMEYRKYKLLRICADAPIITELGGNARVEGSFSAAYSLLERQANGETGFLQTNGYANIFYSNDKKGELCAIRLGWADGGWVLDAISVTDPLAWNGKHEIFYPSLARP